MVTQQEAESIFLKTLMHKVYLGSQEGLKEMLFDEPLPVHRNTNWPGIHDWFIGLNENQRDLFLSAINQAVSFTIFNFLVLLDNKTTGYPLDEIPSDFGLYLQSAEDQDQLFNYLPSESIRINRSYSVGGDLHDAFQELVEDYKKGS